MMDDGRVELGVEWNLLMLLMLLYYQNHCSCLHMVCDCRSVIKAGDDGD